VPTTSHLVKSYRVGILSISEFLPKFVKSVPGAVVVGGDVAAAGAGGQKTPSFRIWNNRDK
jgi:hypothetical protein